MQIRDDQYEYKVISDDQLDKDFGTYECYKNGKLVPYPARVLGTDMWRRAREVDAVAANSSSASTSTPSTRGRGRGRGSNKRRALEPPEAQPTPKRSTRGLVDDSQLLAPRASAPTPAKGLLASAAQAEAEEAVLDEESIPASPEPPSMANGGFASALTKDQQNLPAREKSPLPPKNAADPDDFGVRIYNQKPSMKERGINSRLLAPHLFRYDDYEIGFRDSTNDSSRGHTRAKRGKYLDKPNSNGMHFDHWCNGFDYSTTGPEDFDQELVERHGIHPKYGIFLPGSVNEQEVPGPYVIPGKPVVFVANPSGRLSHAARSFQTTVNHRNADDAPWRSKFATTLHRYCKMNEVDSADISVQEYLPSEEELRKKSLGTALRELESKPLVNQAAEEEEITVGEAELDEKIKAQFSLLTFAGAYVEAQETTRPAPPTPKPARYDAIRDVFTDAKPAPAPAPEGDRVALNFLAELCNVEKQLPASLDSYDPYRAPRVFGQPVAVPEPQIADSGLRSTMSSEMEPRGLMYGHAPRLGSMAHVEPSNAYSHNPPLGPPPMQSVPVAHGAPVEHGPYRFAHEQQAVQQPPPIAPPQALAAGPPVQEYSGYAPHGSYGMSDPRDSHLAPRGSMDAGYGIRRLSGYGHEPAAYPPPIWSHHQPGPPGGHPPPQHYQPPPPPPPPQQSRMPFSHNAGAEPLPPLRPPRAVSSQPLPEEPVFDHSMRHGSHGSVGSYYPLAPSRSYHHGPDTHPPLHPISTERMMPSPQQPSQSYVTSPQQGYGSQMLSPTYGNPMMGGQMGQSPPGTPLGPPGSAHRHRSTPSGSSDAGSNKYRKLQPAPVPAHRAGWSKQELKTIPYDVKEMGSSAALPNSGPTQIRGWNVNQHRKRGKSDRQERAEPGNERDDSR